MLCLVATVVVPMILVLSIAGSLTILEEGVAGLIASLHVVLLIGAAPGAFVLLLLTPFLILVRFNAFYRGRFCALFRLTDAEQAT